MDFKQGRGIKRREIRWSSERLKRGSAELRQIIEIITAGIPPGGKKEETKHDHQ